MEGLCKYRNIAGVPGTGLHSIRLFGIAIVDLLMTLAAAYLIAWYKNYGLQGFFVVASILLVLGIIAHRLFCVNTTLNIAIFGKLP
jgi:Na+/melibiose symporter-like transporter